MVSDIDIAIALAIGWHSEGKYEPGSKYFVLIGPHGEKVDIKSPTRKPITDAIENDEVIPRYTRDFPAIWKLFNEYIFPHNPETLKDLGDLSDWLKKDPYEACEELCKIFLREQTKITGRQSWFALDP